MFTRKMFLPLIVVIILLTACDAPATPPPTSAPTSTNTPAPTLTHTPTETSSPTPYPSPLPPPLNAAQCDTLDLSDDLVSGFSVFTTHPINQKEYGCLVVSGDDGFPVLAGKQSFRIEVRPGDCSASSGWDDCPNDRSRHEIQEVEDTNNGEISIYEVNYYVPFQPKFKPRGDNLMFIGQLNTEDETYHGTLVYLEVDNDQNLLLRTHKGFSWDIDKQVVVATDIFERWINIRYEVYASTDSGGYFRVYIDDKLVLSESRPTIPSQTGYVELRVGIYNGFISEAEEAFENQVIYVDQMEKR